jgi:K+ transporter
VASLVCALLGLLPCCGIVLGPAAYLLGRASLHRIRSAEGRLGGTGIANTGQILGAIVAILWALVVIVYVIFIVARVRRGA